MAELATLARPYGNAAFEIARGSEEGLDSWSRQLALMAAAVDDDGFRSRLQNPGLPADARATMLADLLGDEIQPSGRRLLSVLSENDRLELLPQVRDRFEELKAAEQKVVDVEIVSAWEMDQSEIDTVVEALSKRFDDEIHVETRVDQSIIGGAIIRAGDLVIDGSVQGRLEKLRESLLRA